MVGSGRGGLLESFVCDGAERVYELRSKSASDIGILSF